MPIVEWKEAYSVNIAEIDEQHKILIGLINHLHTAILSGKGKDVTKEVIDRLFEYTDFHFLTEEKYLKLYDYPESEEHIQKHRELKENVEILRNRADSSEDALTIELMNFLRDWLHDHILGYDVVFGNYAKNK